MTSDTLQNIWTTNPEYEQHLKGQGINNYLCEFKLSERDNLLYDIATRYHMECETYDRTVCTGPVRDGSILPANRHELALINRNATRVRRNVLADAARNGFTWTEVDIAISKWDAGSIPSVSKT